MGTDIHLAVEVRRNGIWENVTPFKEEDGYLSNYPNGFYETRNYDMFAMLADVRNGYGFAGVDTGNGFVPLTKARGIPKDASPDVRRWAEDGDHSHSFCTLAELLAYDWTQKTKKRGIVGSFKQLARWKIQGSPDAWCGGTSGPGIEIFTMTPDIVAWFDQQVEQAKQIDPRFSWWSLYHADDDDRWGNEPAEAPGLASLRSNMAAKFGCAHPHFQLEWEVPYFRPAKEFLSETMPKLWRLGAPDDVRLVYWFDS